MLCRLSRYNYIIPRHPEHLTNIISDGLHGNRMHIDGFLPVSELGIQYRKAVSKGVACHWLAGNVQVLGMFVLIQSILTKNVNLLKVSSRDNGVFAYLLSAFEDEVYTAPSGYTIKGDDLLKTIAVVYYNHDDAEIGGRANVKNGRYTCSLGGT